MKVLYYDCFCGISGDMNLGALLDLGVDTEYLRQALSQLQLDDEFELRVIKAVKKGISGTRVDVILKNEHHHVRRDSESTSQHGHEHHHHKHDEGQNITQGSIEHTHHAHRNLHDIENIINGSALSEKVKQLSLAMFMQIAKAEAKVHGKALQEVHFHEVGATDSIVDIVGAAICLDYLNIDTIIGSPVQVGGGFVKCAHGIIPVPAPATVEILKGIPMKSGIVPFETTTPTGAAILAANVKQFTENIEFAVDKIGYGIGHRDLEIPNILRVYIGHQETNSQKELQYILETNIDDMNPELYGYIEEKLLAQGALDVFKTAISMKKGRIATKLSVLVSEKREKKILDVIFRETTSIGVRKYPVEKIMLQRDFVQVTTQYGNVNVKNAYYQGEKIKSKPEYEDCKKIAEEQAISIVKVYEEVYKMLK